MYIEKSDVFGRTFGVRPEYPLCDDARGLSRNLVGSSVLLLLGSLNSRLFAYQCLQQTFLISMSLTRVLECFHSLVLPKKF